MDETPVHMKVVKKKKAWIELNNGFWEMWSIHNFTPVEVSDESWLTFRYPQINWEVSATKGQEGMWYDLVEVEQSSGHLDVSLFVPVYVIVTSQETNTQLCL